jgi:chromosome segregation ATPase
MSPASEMKNTFAAVLPLAVLAALALAGTRPAHAEGSVYYVCPGNVFTNTITPKEAEQRNCKAKEAAQPTTIAAPRLRGGVAVASGAASRASDARVDPAEQKARDTDSRRILQDELQKAETQLASLQKEYNNGEPERRGEEKNYQRYLDRVADLKAAIARTESDVAALRRELAKLPSAP